MYAVQWHTSDCKGSRQAGAWAGGGHSLVLHMSRFVQKKKRLLEVTATSTPPPVRHALSLDMQQTSLPRQLQHPHWRVQGPVLACHACEQAARQSNIEKEPHPRHLHARGSTGRATQAPHP